MLNRASIHKWISQYKVDTKTGYFFVDFYCEAINVVVEYDELYHSNATQRLKDITREKLIVDATGCTFYRYKRNSSMPFYLFANTICHKHS